MTSRLIPMKVVLDRVCFSKTQLYRMIRAGSFPKPVPIGRQKVAFLEAEVDDWIAARLQEREDGVGASGRAEQAKRAAAARHC